MIIGPTGSGKTTIARPIIDRREYSVMLVAKGKDATITKEFSDWKRFTEWPKNGFTRLDKRVMIWPKPEATIELTRRKQKYVFRAALDKINSDGSWCVFADEMLYFTAATELGLGAEISYMHYFGRSSGLSMVTASQRPFNIPRVVLSSASHVYIAKTADAGDQKRLSDFGGVDAKEVVANMKRLESRFDFIYLNPQGDSNPVIVNSRK